MAVAVAAAVALNDASWESDPASGQRSDEETAMTPPQDRRHYQAPDAFTRKVFNPLVAWLTRRGVSLLGSRVLEVRGRRSGEWRSTPVNLHVLDGTEYLVAARGETEWVRNLRAAGGGRLRLGRRSWTFEASELDDDAKPDVLRTYLERWQWEVGRFFGEVRADSPDDVLRAAAPRHPVFAITTRAET